VFPRALDRREDNIGGERRGPAAPVEREPGGPVPLDYTLPPFSHSRDM
jgi:hypothetical protein